jgi:hypothetical protein
MVMHKNHSLASSPVMPVRDDGASGITGISPTDMHPGRQVLEIRIRHQLCVSSSLRRFGFVFGIVRGYIRRSDRDRIGVQNSFIAI